MRCVLRWGGPDKNGLKYIENGDFCCWISLLPFLHESSSSVMSNISKI